MEQFFFYFISAIILIFSILTVVGRKILRVAVYLLFALIGIAALFFLMDYYFQGAVQLMIYAGGIIVLIIFSIMLTSNIDLKFERVSRKKSMASALLCGTGALITSWAILTFDFKPSGLPPLENSMRQLGFSLLGRGAGGYVLPFEVITILLLAAMVGAIVIAKKQKNE